MSERYVCFKGELETRTMWTLQKIFSGLFIYETFVFFGCNVAVLFTYYVSNLQTTGDKQLSLINAIKNWPATEKMVYYIETT